MKPKIQKQIKFVNSCNCIVDYDLLEKALLWYADDNLKTPRKIFMYGKYPGVNIYNKKIHIHRLLMMYWLKRNLEKGEYVHHLNERKLDASRQNLFLYNASKHQQFTRKGRKLTLKHRKNIGEANKKRKGMKYKKRIHGGLI